MVSAMGLTTVNFCWIDCALCNSCAKYIEKGCTFNLVPFSYVYDLLEVIISLRNVLISVDYDNNWKDYNN